MTLRVLALIDFRLGCTSPNCRGVLRSRCSCDIIYPTYSVHRPWPGKVGPDLGNYDEAEASMKQYSRATSC